MKQLLAFIIAATMALALCACAAETPADGKDNGAYTVRWLDEDGTTVLATESVKENEYVVNKDLGKERNGYEKIWTTADGRVFEFEDAVMSDMDLVLSYEPYPTTTLFSKETLSLINTPAEITVDPGENYLNNYQFFAMTMSVEVTKNGRMWSLWAGGEDGAGAFLMATYSDDDGKTWKDVQVVVDPHDEDLPMIMNSHVGALWLDPDGRLFLFYQQSFGMWDGCGANYYIRCDDPDAEDPVWSDPVYVSPGASVKKPIILSNGEWLLPVSIWERWHISSPLQETNYETDKVRGARAYVSRDKGETWEYRGGIDFTGSNFNEHSIVELSDGRLMMYSRCSSAIKKSYSSNQGKTWTREEVAFPHVNSMATVVKAPSGNLILVKHGSDFETATGTRCVMTVFLSEDDGETWKGGLVIDARTEVSYPDVAFDGEYIVVQYDYNRASNAEILFARFTEEEILAKKIDSDAHPKSVLRAKIKASAGVVGGEYPKFDTASTAFEGSGTEADPYKISSADDFILLAKLVDGGESFDGKYFLQTADISFGGKEIQPVGYNMQYGVRKQDFRGNYDGGNYKISNFSMDAPWLYSRALFGYKTGGYIKNVRVYDAYISGSTNTAIILGNATPKGNSRVVVENCYVDGSVKLVCVERAGGIVGYAEKADIINCENNAEITITYQNNGRAVFVGGIVGSGVKFTVTNCVNNGEINVKFVAAASVGGICGEAEEGVIKNCVNTGTVSMTGNVDSVYVGGVVGAIYRRAELLGCINTGDINVRAAFFAGVGGVAGMIGNNIASTFEMNDCYNSGNIKTAGYGEGGTNVVINVGGLVGLANAKSASGKGPNSVQGNANVGKVYKVKEFGKTVVTADAFIGELKYASQLTLSDNYSVTTAQSTKNTEKGAYVLDEAKARERCSAIDDAVKTALGAESVFWTK